MIRCPNCGAENQTSARFCIKCGEKIVDFAPPSLLRSWVSIAWLAVLILVCALVGVALGTGLGRLEATGQIPNLGLLCPSRASPAATVALTPAFEIEPSQSATLVQTATPTLIATHTPSSSATAVATQAPTDTQIVPTRTLSPGPTGPTPTLTPTLKPTPVPSPAVVGTGFDYGIQVHPYNVDLNQLVSAVQGLGLRWVKFQVRWIWIEPQQGQRNWNAYGLEDAVNAFHNAGIKILLNVVAAPKWSRSIHEEAGPLDDFNLYAEFVNSLGRHFKGRIKAIEVMNETNLKREWNTGRPLSAAEYVDLLCRAYSSIKAVDPSIVVVSGAPTPTGWNDGIMALDDVVYLDQMYQAGLKNCSDAVGVHPWGYNNPPDVDWQTWHDPTATFNAKGHRSWFFQATISAYHSVMQRHGDSNKRLWATKWGWASIENIAPEPVPGWDYAADNTEAEQAEFLVKAFQIARDRGYMGVMFVWNLNYAPVCGVNCEQAHFSIVRPDWSFRPAYQALAAMPK